MDEALVKNSQNDVDGGERGDDQHFLVRERVLKGLRGALKRGVDGVRHLKFAAGRFNMIDGRAKRGAGSEVEGKRNRREDALMVDGKRGVGRFVVRERAERNELAGVRGNIDGFQRFR